MALTRIAAFITRGLQILFGAVVLALSVTALRWQQWGHAPAANGYTAFVGAFALLAGLIGLTSLFVSKLEKPVLIADAVTATMLFAGGIAYAIQLKGVNRKNGFAESTRHNKLINGGCDTISDDYDWCERADASVLQQRCKVAEANATFLFLGFLAAVAALVMGVMVVRKAKRSYGTSSGV